MVSTNLLGCFTNTYAGTSGRVDTNFFPNGQRTEFTYLDNLGNKRLQTILHRSAGGAPISRFDYTYDSEAILKTWSRQFDSQNPTVWTADYDAGDQLLTATLHTNSSAGTTLKEFAYGYDKAGNRTSQQVDSSASTAACDQLGQLTNITLGGPIRFGGHLSETGSVLVAGAPAAMTGRTNFVGFATLSAGTDTVQIAATDLSANATTNNYQLVVTNNGVARAFTYDLNGNLISDISALSTNTYEWDAADRLTKITRTLTNSPQQTSEFTYDCWGRRVRIVEKTNGTVQADQRFVWLAADLGEERDSTGTNITKRFFASGEQISGTNYFYTKDHLGSICELLDASENIHARYDYDPYGNSTKLSGDLDSDFGFTGRHRHTPSGLYLTLFRAYDSTSGRWLSRDPIGEPGSLNLYAYVENNPFNFIDPYGLATVRLGKLAR